MITAELATMADAARLLVDQDKAARHDAASAPYAERTDPRDEQPTRAELSETNRRRR